tara:strand:- start:1789 stop:2526 length:738 start_codon:yes stop_codon:yes gene_type:complete
MFKAISKNILVLFSSLLLMGTSGFHHTEHNVFNSNSEIVENAHRNLSSVEKSVRNAAVKVKRADGSYGSGTLLRIKDTIVVATAAHVVGDFKTFELIGQLNETIKGTIVYKHAKKDIAFILPEKSMTSRKPMQFKPINRRKNQVGNRITYTGFPNEHNLLTIRGSIAGYDHKEDVLLIQSFAWMGSSGSGVFDLSGRFIGVVSAIDVGVAYYPQLIETMVWISPSWNVSESVILDKIKNKDEDKK